jgi:hypothetical protein
MRLMTGHVTTEFRFDRLDGSLCIGTLLFVLSEEVVHFFSFQQTLYVFVTYFVTPFLYRSQLLGFLSCAEERLQSGHGFLSCRRAERKRAHDTGKDVDGQ